MEPGEAWGIVGLACYLGAATLFAIGVGSLVPGNENVVSTDPIVGVGLLVASAMLLVLGTVGLRRASAGHAVDGSHEPERSEVEEDGLVRCVHCGTENEAGYRYCASCANAL